MIKFFQLLVERQSEVLWALREHLWLVFVPVALATLVSVPLGILATRFRRLEFVVMGVANVLQTVPSLALLALMIPLGFGIGNKPAMIALFLYALLPILRNTYLGIKSVDDGIKEAATGMGMTYLQRLRIVELPIAVSVIIGGIRTATVIIIGTATLAALIGGGGLGSFIVSGLGMVRDEMILLGAVPAAFLAILVDFLFGKLEHVITPRGLRLASEE